MPIIFNRNCNWCKKHYSGEGKKFCSHKCSTLYRHSISKFGIQKGQALTATIKPRKCTLCNTMFKPKLDKRIYCSKKCSTANMSGNNHPNWRGGKSMTSNGYVVKWINTRERMLEHRYVMQQHIGRVLGKSEHVHHINGDKTDNRIENLQLLSHAEHNKLHAKEQWSGDGVLRNR